MAALDEAASTALLDRLRDARRQGDMATIIAAVPYCRWLGLTAGWEPDRPGSPKRLVYRMPFAQGIVGNPALPALHGGAVGAFLESVALLELLRLTEIGRIPKTITVSINYLNSARPLDCQAAAYVTKLGRRIGNVRALAWQDDESRPVAELYGNFLLSEGLA